MFRKFLKDLIASEKKYLKRERLRCSEIIIEATCKSVKLVTMFLFLILSLDNKTKLFKSWKQSDLIFQVSKKAILLISLP